MIIDSKLPHVAGEKKAKRILGNIRRYSFIRNRFHRNSPGTALNTYIQKDKRGSEKE